MKLRRKILALLAASALMGLVPAMLAPVAATHGNPCQNFLGSAQQGRRGDAGTSSSLYWGGIRAQLTPDPENLHLCTNPATNNSRANAVWIGVWGTGARDIAQIGVVQCRQPGPAPTDSWTGTLPAACYGFDGTSLTYQKEFLAWGSEALNLSPFARNPARRLANSGLPSCLMGTADSGIYWAKVDVTKLASGYRFAFYCQTSSSATDSLITTVDLPWRPRYVGVSVEHFDPGDGLGGTSGDRYRVTSGQTQFGANSWTSSSFLSWGAFCQQETCGSAYHDSWLSNTTVDFWSD